MSHYLCIHGHFYQPPRENPWTNELDLEESAKPYQNWNERITAECYRPNTEAKILGPNDETAKTFNNFSRISFNFGPTLLAWIQAHAPDVYKKIMEADGESQKFFSGHGSALAQAYNHTILPLSNKRDKFTQIYWGLRDFEHRFKRKPEGFWLPETAVDLESLGIMASLGIKFTILAPHQALTKNTDIKKPYSVTLASGKKIAVFFYDGPISRAIAFEKLLKDGHGLAQKILKGFDPPKNYSQLISIATDGETYGHHHKFGEMALAYVLDFFENKNEVKLTNFAEFLGKFPPQNTVQIKEKTSWSCSHGIERWRSDCGCRVGENPQYSQAWRGPLREALEKLQEKLDRLYEKKVKMFIEDPWALRNDYISVILDHSLRAKEDFLQRWAVKKLDKQMKIVIFKLLKMEKATQMMFTSCGWFFDDPSGLETRIILNQAGYALEIAEELGQTGLREAFLEDLSQAKSNKKDSGNCRLIFENLLRAKPV